MSLWSIITGNSSLPVQAGNSLWDHLNSQSRGVLNVTTGLNPDSGEIKKATGSGAVSGITGKGSVNKISGSGTIKRL